MSKWKYEKSQNKSHKAICLIWCGDGQVRDNVGCKEGAFKEPGEIAAMEEAFASTEVKLPLCGSIAKFLVFGLGSLLVTRLYLGPRWIFNSREHGQGWIGWVPHHLSLSYWSFPCLTAMTFREN